MSSDSDEYSDEDYNPEKDVSEAGSEMESEEDVEDDLPDSSSESKGKDKSPRKRKAQGTKGSRNKRAKHQEEEISKNTSKVSENTVEEEDDDDEAEKRRADALWADFLGGDSVVDDKPKEPKPRSQTTRAEEKKPTVAQPKEELKKKDPVVIKEIFEFAGEQVVVEKTVPVDAPPKSSGSTPRISGGGLGSILGAINKKNKISTLEKTKLDWDRFKNTEGITEDLNTFNRGKDGYLERQDFLQRTDVRQFELERSMRQTTRSNR